MDLSPNLVKPIGGRLGFFDEEERESVFERVTDGVKETAVILTELVKGTLTFQEVKQQSLDGEREKKQQEAYHKKDFYQAMEGNRRDMERSRVEQAMEDLARMEVGAMSALEKNVIEGLNADLKAEYTNNPYHISNIRNKRLEQIRNTKKNQQAESMAVANGRKNLVNSLDAQEGQSMISASGAITSAG